MAGNCMTEALPKLLTTAIGSMPHTDADAAVNLILDSLKAAPHLPQLSRRDPCASRCVDTIFGKASWFPG